MTTPQDPNPGQRLQPNPDEVNELHRYDDSDNSPESHHHTLGVDPNQSSPGTHNHDGRNSASLSANSHAHTASGVANVPAGTIAATNVQAALDELDTEKSATGHTHAPPGLLGYCQYDPATAVTKLTAALAYAALDTTNLRATFVAPVSGVVIVEFGAWGSNNGVNSNGPSLGILDGSTVKANSGFQGMSPAGSTFGPISTVRRISGLTSGTTYNWDLAYASSQTSSVVISYGGGTDGTAYGAAFLFVRAG